MDISVQSNAQNRTFAIKVYNKSGANYYKVLERGQDSKTGKWTSWTTVKGYYSFSGKYKRFTVAKNASDNKFIIIDLFAITRITRKLQSTRDSKRLYRVALK